MTSYYHPFRVLQPVVNIIYLPNIVTLLQSSFTGQAKHFVIFHSMAMIVCFICPSANLQMILNDVCNYAFPAPHSDFFWLFSLPLRYQCVLLMSHDIYYNRRSALLALNQFIMTGSWLCVISPVPPAELQRYDQSWGADVRLGNGGSSLELNYAPERRKCSFSIRWKDQRRRIIQLSHLQWLGEQDAVCW